MGAQSPESDIVDPKTGEPKTESILTFEQAKSLWDNFLQDNRERNNKNAAIQRKRDGEQPYKPSKLRAAGQSWRSNRPTGFMQSLLKRLLPPYKQMVDQLPRLTYSTFPNDKLGSDKEKDIFQKNITNTVRAWTGWPDLITQIADENVTFGYAAAVFADEYAWEPKMYRGDEALFYVGCPQEAKKTLTFCLKVNMYVHEAVELLREVEASKSAGWRVGNLIKKLNTGTTQEFDNVSTSDNSRVYEDLIRENNLANSFVSSVKVLKMVCVYTTDPNGGINKYVVDREDGTPFFFKRQMYDSMDEVLNLFSAEVGDRTLHGSKGAGRALYNTHVTVEQARNLINDALHLSGLLILKRSTREGSGTTQTPGLTVNHPFAIIGDGYEVLEKVKFEVNSEAFFALDRQATSQAEVQIGAFMPGQLTNQEGDKRTASEVNYVASIDAQIRAGILARWADQVFNMIDQMQRRLCHPDVVAAAQEIFDQTNQGSLIPIFEEKLFADMQKAKVDKGFALTKIPAYLDKSAVQCCLKMLQEGMTTQQILILANQSSRANVDDAIASQSGVLDMIVMRYINDPDIDGIELRRRDIASKLGGEAADRLMNVDLSPLSAVKQGRIQLSELTTMLNGNDTPVDVTDDHKVHLAYIMDRIQPMMADPTIAPLTSSQDFLKRVVAHADQHIQTAIQTGHAPNEFEQESAFLETLRQFIQQPTLEQQAQSQVDQVTGGGGAPMLPTPGAPLPPNTPAPLPSGTPADIISNVAVPPEPEFTTA